MRARTIFFLSALAPLAGFNHLAFSKRKVSGEVPSFSQRPPGFAVRTCLRSIATAQAAYTCAVATRSSLVYCVVIDTVPRLVVPFAA